MPFPNHLATKRGQHRLHNYLYNVIVHSCMETAASDTVLGEPPRVGIFADIFLTCSREQKDIVIPATGVLHNAIFHDVPKRLHLEIVDKPDRPPARTFISNGFSEVTRAFHHSMFSQFSEAASEWVKTNHSTDFKKWPPIANFCRVVRNAIVHGGTINTRDTEAPTVEWRGLAYNHESRGRKIFELDLRPVDLVILLFDLDAELTDLEAPFDLS